MTSVVGPFMTEIGRYYDFLKNLFVALTAAPSLSSDALFERTLKIPSLVCLGWSHMIIDAGYPGHLAVVSHHPQGQRDPAQRVSSRDLAA